MPDFEKHLAPGEKVLWAGKATDFRILDDTYRAALLRRSLLCAAICAAVLALYAWGVRSSGAFNPWVALVIVLLCAISPIALLNRSRKLKKLTYAATNRRLAILSDTLRFVEYRRIREYAFRQDPAGNTTLLCGRKAVNSKPGKWRETAFFCGGPSEERGQPCEKFALYAVDDPEGLRAVLAEHLPAEAGEVEVISA